MQKHIDKPAVRQAAEMMPAGPDRDALFARAREFFNANNGPFMERRIAAVRRALEMIWRSHEAQIKAGSDEPPKNLREMLRCENQLDRLERSLAALWEAAFKFAREALFRETRKRLATPVFEADETIRQYQERLADELEYAQKRPDFDTFMDKSPLPGLARGKFSWMPDFSKLQAVQATPKGQASAAPAAQTKPAGAA